MILTFPYGNLELTKSMHTGHPAIDDDHRLLIESINAIRHAHDECRMEECRTLILQFTDSIKQHFQKEEKILKEMRFPRFDEHREHHLNIGNDIDAVLEDLHNNIGNREIWGDIYRNLVSIAINDTIKADMDFKSFMNESGLEYLTL